MIIPKVSNVIYIDFLQLLLQIEEILKICTIIFLCQVQAQLQGVQQTSDSGGSCKQSWWLSWIPLTSDHLNNAICLSASLHTLGPLNYTGWFESFIGQDSTDTWRRLDFLNTIQIFRTRQPISLTLSSILLSFYIILNVDSEWFRETKVLKRFNINNVILSGLDFSCFSTQYSFQR